MLSSGFPFNLCSYKRQGLVFGATGVVDDVKVRTDSLTMSRGLNI